MRKCAMSFGLAAVIALTPVTVTYASTEHECPSRECRGNSPFVGKPTLIAEVDFARYSLRAAELPSAARVVEAGQSVTAKDTLKTVGGVALIFGICLGVIVLAVAAGGGA